ncbi:unnamed protein product, partial [Rotaria sp. Silwood1]
GKATQCIHLGTTTTTLAPCAVCTVSIGLVGGGTTLVACNTICAGIGTGRSCNLVAPGGCNNPDVVGDVPGGGNGACTNIMANPICCCIAPVG